MVTTDSFKNDPLVVRRLQSFLAALPASVHASLPAATTGIARALQVWTVSLADFRAVRGAAPAWKGRWHLQLQSPGLPVAGFALVLQTPATATEKPALEVRAVYPSSMAAEIERAFETPALMAGSGLARLLEIHEVQMRALWITAPGKDDSYYPLGRFGAGEQLISKQALIDRLPSQPVTGIALPMKVSYPPPPPRKVAPG